MIRPRSSAPALNPGPIRPSQHKSRPSTTADSKSGSTPPFRDVLLSQAGPSQSLAPQANQRVSLGVLSKDRPTVSHLLASHPEHGRDCWRIVNSAVNRGKPFQSLKPGSSIELDPSSGELFVIPPAPHRASPAAVNGGSSQPDARPPAVALTRQSVTAPAPATTPSGDLARAVGAYHGTSYGQLNCYQLVVRGLEDLGVTYGGTSGLQARLIDKARGEGLPENAYLTGEGLIELAAREIYRGDFQSGSATDKITEQAWREIEPRLASGMLLSFSAGKRGHTGVIARHQGRWTLINSGRIDNDVRGLARHDGVGEEELRAEIRSWLRLAERQGKPLRIVVGQLSPEKLTAFAKPTALKLIA
jgi:hypothetical protein